MSYPDFVVQTLKPELAATPSTARKWFDARIEGLKEPPAREADSPDWVMPEGMVWRETADPDRGVLFEAWRNEPEDFGPLNWS